MHTVHLSVGNCCILSCLISWEFFRILGDSLGVPGNSCNFGLFFSQLPPGFFGGWEGGREGSVHIFRLGDSSTFLN